MHVGWAWAYTRRILSSIFFGVLRREDSSSSVFQSVPQGPAVEEKRAKEEEEKRRRSTVLDPGAMEPRMRFADKAN